MPLVWRDWLDTFGGKSFHRRYRLGIPAFGIHARGNGSGNSRSNRFLQATPRNQLRFHLGKNLGIASYIDSLWLDAPARPHDRFGLRSGRGDPRDIHAYLSISYREFLFHENARYFVLFAPLIVCLLHRWFLLGAVAGLLDCRSHGFGCRPLFCIRLGIRPKRWAGLANPAKVETCHAFQRCKEWAIRDQGIIGHAFP